MVVGKDSFLTTTDNLLFFGNLSGKIVVKSLSKLTIEALLAADLSNYLRAGNFQLVTFKLN